MKFGIYSLPTYFPEVDGSVQDFYRRVIDLFVRAEGAGFHSGWVNEHHFHPFGGMIPQPQVLLAAIAARTSRIRLGTSVSLLPLHHPLALAEGYAMVDQISGGRLDFGIGRGFVKSDYAAYGVPFDEGQDRLMESLDVLLQAWRGEPVRHQGAFYRVEGAGDDGVELWPRVVQTPHPPIWCAATSNPESFALYGRSGYNLLTLLYPRPLDASAESIRIYREAAHEAGLDPSTLQVAAHAMVYCHEDADEARRTGRAAFERYMDQHGAASQRHGQPMVAAFDDMVEQGRLLIGTPDECVAALTTLEETLGLSSVDCAFHWGGMGSDASDESFRVFAETVMPTFSAAALV